MNAAVQQQLSYEALLAERDALAAELAAIKARKNPLSLFSEALAWGLVYGPLLVHTKQWDEARAKMAQQFVSRLGPHSGLPDGTAFAGAVMDVHYFRTPFADKPWIYARVSDPIQYPDAIPYVTLASTYAPKPTPVVSKAVH